jgi:hypothetical protein
MAHKVERCVSMLNHLTHTKSSLKIQHITERQIFFFISFNYIPKNTNTGVHAMDIGTVKK